MARPGMQTASGATGPYRSRANLTRPARPPNSTGRSMVSVRRMASSILFIAASVWLLLSALLYIAQPHFIYFPHRELTWTPSAVGLAYEDVELVTADDIRLHGWYVPAENPAATLLFLHGNAGNISHRLESILNFHGLGLSVFIIDYRGYGRSEGRPSETGTYLDAQAAWEYLTVARGQAPERIVIFGRSLGAGVAAWLATQFTPGAVILESAFTSVEDMARRYYPYLPVRLLVRIHYPTRDRIARVRAPLLVIHSRDDEIIPFEHGRRIHAAAAEPKSLLEIRGGHNDGFLVSEEHYLRGLREFLHRHLPQFPSAA
jgi:fermentation-respiration switch protein FrsA (DUF1100 family)